MDTLTRTVLFTDLADYTGRVSRADREELHRMLSEHEQAVRPVVEGRGGRIVKNIGDSFLCLFPAATEALRAALDIQALEAYRDAQLIRVALNTGDVEVIEDDAFGGPVNLASRILGITPPGEIWFGDGTRACMNEPEIPWERVGSFSLKGVPGEQTCYRAVPGHRTWLPMAVSSAIKAGTLLRCQPGQPLPRVPPGAVVLFEGFAAGSPELGEAIDALPVLEPASYYLAAYRLPAGEREAWRATGRGLVIGTPEAIDRAILEVAKLSARGSAQTLEDSSTMLLNVRAQVDLQLVVCGLALPDVPLSGVVAGYTYDLTPDGVWATSSSAALLRLDVAGDGTWLTAFAEDIAVDGSLVPAGQRTPLHEGTVVRTRAGELRYRALERPYRGIMLLDTERWLGVMNGQTAEIGRKPGPPGLATPARGGDENVRWLPGPRAERARQSSFSLERVLTGRRHAAVEVGNDAVRVLPLHDKLPTYLLRADGLQRVDAPRQVQVGDMLITGTAVTCIRPPE